MDPNEDGSTDNYRDVSAAYYAADGEYLYLRLEMLAAPDTSAARYKWFFDLAANPLSISGGNIEGAEYMMFAENTDIYLLNAGGDESFSEWEGGAYLADPVTNSTIAGYRVTGNYVDMYVRFSALGVSDLSGITSVIWATDQQNPNLEQAPNTDRPDTYPIILGRAVNLLISKTDSPDPVAPSATLTYTITYNNTGNTTAHNVVITDTYDGNVAYASATPPPVAGPGHNIWSIGDLPAGNGGTISINVTVGASANGTILENYVSITCDEPISNNWTEFTTVSAAAVPILFVEKIGSPNPVKAGGTLTYTITVENTGSAAATGVTVVDDYDESILTITDADGGTDNGDTITWSGLTVTAGGSISRTVTATVSSELTESTVVANGVDVDCAQDVQASTEIETTAGPIGPVGGTAYPINKLIVLLPWIGLAAALIAGIVILERRRRAQS